ncbi:Helicase conserved C-terminal domain-containing protein [Micromonospora pattaloongensis]|uniref:Helicase conserved C-terminal domain-containing protein n=1 Tax=Micromonospora pattaloongensis TaxID=405436 RepID=A0A1H3M262_9ACTN|nr:helicase C-terminal domain-containing protein [Micromonospora pattaloongensis]SDY70666.1 Helicase conserved C-terminal domain-containing protein [Micromonospora pattaloongensis]
MSSPLARWLATLDPDSLAGLLARRPDALRDPAPADLPALAARLQERNSAVAALASLPRPAVQLVEALQSIGGPTVDRERLAAAVGRAPDDARLDEALGTLAGSALVWPDGAALRMAAPLWSVFAHPLGLGPPAARLLSTVPAGELSELAGTLGLPRARTRHELLAVVATALADPDRIAALVATAPPDARELLRAVAGSGPLVPAPPQFEVRSPDGPAIAWAVRHGLLVWDGWHHAQMPREVAIALRGPDRAAPFDPDPPVMALAPATPDAVAREAAAAATAAVERISALLDAASTTPVTLLKAGGVGSRELRRLGRATDCAEPETRLWLELAYTAGLLGIAGGQAQPTDAYDEWCDGEPAARLPALLRAWQQLPGAPLAEHRPDGGPPSAPLLRDGAWLAAYDLRPVLLRVAAELPDGQGVVDGVQVAAALAWRLPMLIGATGGLAELLAGLWEEARLLGIVAHGALTPLGRALTDDPAALDDAAAALLPPAVREAVFQTDLTVVVPGIPAAAVAELLDAAAERESRGGATIWRITSGSLRAALDAGYDPAELLDALRDAAVGRSLPQALEYLLADVARRHGRMRVRAVGCVLRADDPALLAEIVRSRALRPLGLALLAPTVLASAKPVADTLAALRAAGYAPAAEDSDGELLVERATKRRAPALRRRGRPPAGRERTAAAGVDVAELARRLLAAPLPEPVPEQELAPVLDLRPRLVTDAVEAAVREHATQLSDGEQRLLVTAVATGEAVRINYRNAGGDFSVRVVEPTEVERHLLVGWCHLRDEERAFALDRIERVSPA